MVHCFGDCGSDTSQPDFSYPARAKLINLPIGVVEEVHVDRWRVGVHRHHVIGEVAIDGRAVLRIVSGGFNVLVAIAAFLEVLCAASPGGLGPTLATGLVLTVFLVQCALALLIAYADLRKTRAHCRYSLNV